MMLDWILQKANIPRELVAEKRFQRTGPRNKNSVDKAKIVFTEPAPKRILDHDMKNDKIIYTVGFIIWHEYYLQGRWTESPFAQEALAILNILWQVFKNDLRLGTQWIESEQGADLHHAISSIRSKRDHMPLIQLIMDENSEQGRPDMLGFHTSGVSVQGQECRFYQEDVQCEIARRQEHRIREPQEESGTTKSTALRPTDPEPLTAGPTHEPQRLPDP